MHVRFSAYEDKDDIEKLITLCFGERVHSGVLDNLNGRYLLVFEENKLIAMTGLSYSEIYQGYEIDWTCTHPQYQHKGVMHVLFERVCSLTDEDIYCSCWRLENKENANLHALMRDFGFKEVIRNRASFDSRYNCKSARTYCVYAKDKTHCMCYEDLWLRKNINER